MAYNVLLFAVFKFLFSHYNIYDLQEPAFFFNSVFLLVELIMELTTRRLGNVYKYLTVQCCFWISTI